MQHERYMKRCLELAELANGHTAPNPMVGAVLVHNNRIIGEGWHRQYGEPHAEVNCINSVTTHDRHLIPESIMYVSLEPCAHYGKTPPCAELLVRERVKEVIICNTDPFEKVSGNGIKILQNAGITVSTGLLKEDGEWLNRRFFTFHRAKRPYIILKWAQSSDGKIAPANGQRLQISNQHTKQLVHKWRTEEAAIMVGTNTALADNPELTARLWEGKNPLRIVLDKSLRLPETLHLLSDGLPTWVINEAREEVIGNKHYLSIPFSESLLPALLQKMQEHNLLSLFVEGGSTLLQSFIDAGLWDEARIFNAPTSMPDGIDAPKLKGAQLKETTPIADNMLAIFIKSR